MRYFYYFGFFARFNARPLCLFAPDDREHLHISQKCQFSLQMMHPIHFHIWGIRRKRESLQDSQPRVGFCEFSLDFSSRSLTAPMRQDWTGNKPTDRQFAILVFPVTRSILSQKVRESKGK